ncbi:hypothetical protein AC579_9995 [Pseudocercospora musae]|uniref:Myb-like domain-containing protein n=1 Tax=Pseudocercospora musae TaxID=113226 RepID=A0A139I4S4_9PEZI|nr:hypothetical protein AC579_9995 [Pseudocercospora musae]KXT09733.1 hypothetical protein AC579_9995 [Pseudocercospora musae]
MSDNQEYQPEKEKPKRKSTKGRKLMRWNPDVDQLALLCVDYIVTTEGVPLDWEKVANVISPDVTGDALKQHLLKLRKAREEAGLPVPPASDRKSARRARNMLNGGMPSTAPARGRKRKAETVLEEDDDGYDDAIVSDKPKGTSVNKSGSLLYNKPGKRATNLKLQNAAASAAKKQENEVKNEAKSDSDGMEKVPVPDKKPKGKKKDRRAGQTDSLPVSSASFFESAAPVSAAPSYYAFAAYDQTPGITMPQQQMELEDAKMLAEEEQNLAYAPVSDAFFGAELPTNMPYDYGMAGEPLPSFGEIPFAHTNGLSLFTGSYESSEYSGGSFGSGVPEAPRLEWIGDSFTSGEEQGDFGVYGGEDYPLFPGLQ